MTSLSSTPSLHSHSTMPPHLPIPTAEKKEKLKASNDEINVNALLSDECLQDDVEPEVFARALQQAARFVQQQEILLLQSNQHTNNHPHSNIDIDHKFNSSLPAQNNNNNINNGQENNENENQNERNLFRQWTTRMKQLQANNFQENEFNTQYSSSVNPSSASTPSTLTPDDVTSSSVDTNSLEAEILRLKILLAQEESKNVFLSDRNDSLLSELSYYRSIHSSQQSQQTTHNHHSDSNAIRQHNHNHSNHNSNCYHNSNNKCSEPCDILKFENMDLKKQNEILKKNIHQCEVEMNNLLTEVQELKLKLNQTHKPQSIAAPSNDSHLSSSHPASSSSASPSSSSSSSSSFVSSTDYALFRAHMCLQLSRLSLGHQQEIDSLLPYKYQSLSLQTSLFESETNLNIERELLRYEKKDHFKMKQKYRQLQNEKDAALEVIVALSKQLQKFTGASLSVSIVNQEQIIKQKPTTVDTSFDSDFMSATPKKHSSSDVSDLLPISPSLNTPSPSPSTTSSLAPSSSSSAKSWSRWLFGIPQSKKSMELAQAQYAAEQAKMIMAAEQQQQQQQQSQPHSPTSNT